MGKAHNRKDLTGMKFGNLTVLEYSHTEGKVAFWRVQCTCGNIKIMRKSSLLAGAKTCGKCIKPQGRHTKDLIGQKIGKLLVLEKSTPINGRTTWKCQCDCGNICIKTAKVLLNGHTKSCGCLRGENHKLSDTNFYGIWCAMKKRCDNPNDHSYKYYGGRGITYHPSWKSFSNFYEDMYESYLEHCKKHGERNTSIDRIDNNSNYSKDNCRWATREEQCNNTRRNHIIEVEGDLLTVAQASEKYDIHYQTILGRIRNGKDIFGKREQS